MRIAFSPCPNDTFLFYAWVHRKIQARHTPSVHLADIQELNRSALEGGYDLLKVSFANVPSLMGNYQVLPVGAALGEGCGPLLVARSPFPLGALSQLRVAVPGRDTTAHLLLQLLCPAPKQKRFCLYHEAPHLLAEGVVDAALIIHEHRFTYASMGFVELADLGVLWEEREHLPIPLGCLVLRRTLEADAADIVATIGASLDYAHRHSDEALPYLLKHSQELSPEVVQRHVETYVTSETAWLSDVGVRAVERLLRKGQVGGLKEDWLWRS